MELGVVCGERELPFQDFVLQIKCSAVFDELINKFILCYFKIVLKPTLEREINFRVKTREKYKIMPGHARVAFRVCKREPVPCPEREFPGIVPTRVPNIFSSGNREIFEF